MMASMSSDRARQQGTDTADSCSAAGIPARGTHGPGGTAASLAGADSPRGATGGGTAGAAADVDSPPIGAAFLLTQLGAHAAEQFAGRIAAIGLTPPLAGLLRAIVTVPGQSQQALARHLRTQPSRIVAFVDDLEGRELIERRRNPQDRRLHALYLTPKGQEASWSGSGGSPGSTTTRSARRSTLASAVS